MNKRHQTEEDIEIANNHMKRCLSPLPKRKMQSKILVRYNSIRMALKKNIANTKGYGATGTLISVGMQNNRTNFQRINKFLEVKHKLAIQSNNPVPKNLPSCRLQPSGQIQHPDWTRHICFCIVSGCF